jgi:hypothetical protein
MNFCVSAKQLILYLKNSRYFTANFELAGNYYIAAGIQITKLALKKNIDEKNPEGNIVLFAKK